jgi:hypothetical protein
MHHRKLCDNIEDTERHLSMGWAVDYAGWVAAAPCIALGVV